MQLFKKKDPKAEAKSKAEFEKFVEMDHEEKIFFMVDKLISEGELKQGIRTIKIDNQKSIPVFAVRIPNGKNISFVTVQDLEHEIGIQGIMSVDGYALIQLKPL